MKGRIPAVIAIVTGAVAVLLVNVQLRQMEPDVPPRTRTFYRAEADIAPGGTVAAALDESHLLRRVAGIPEALARAHPDALDAERESSRPRTIARPVRAGEFLTAAHLTAPPPPDALATPPAGHAVITIPVVAESPTEQPVAAGDRVDVYLVETKNDARVPGGVAVSRTKVAGDVVIWRLEAPAVRVDGSPARPRGTSSSVTVAAPIEVVGRLMAARVQGRLSLVRRRP